MPAYYDVSEWITMPVFHPPYFIEHLLPRGGVMLIYGQTGVMKSWLVQHLAFSVATGNDWLGFRTTQGRVLLGNFEISSPTYHSRLCLMSANFALEPQTLFVCSPSILYLDEQRNLDWFKDNIIEPVNPDVIVLDCMSNCFGGDENASQDMSRFIRNIEELKAETRSIVLIHHSNKNLLALSPMDRARGHSKLVGWADSILYMVKQPTSKQIQFGKVRHAPFEFHSINLVFENYLWSLRGGQNAVRQEVGRR